LRSGRGRENIHQCSFEFRLSFHGGGGAKHEVRVIVGELDVAVTAGGPEVIGDLLERGNGADLRRRALVLDAYDLQLNAGGRRRRPGRGRREKSNSSLRAFPSLTD